jgi:hypothetical protein
VELDLLVSDPVLYVRRFLKLKASINLAKYLTFRGNPPPQRKNESADVIWGKNMKRGREKGGKCKRKRKKG